MGYGIQNRQQGLVALLFLASLPQLGLAAVDRYDYDASGRLTQRVDEQSRATGYQYDAAGNVTEVSAQGPAQPPVVSSGPLGDIRRNELRQVAVGGAYLANTIVVPSHTSIAVSNLIQSATAVSFRLAIGADVPLGKQSLRFVNSAGVAEVELNVIPALAISFQPEPISVAPDGVARKFVLNVGDIQGSTRAFTLGTLSPATAKSKTSQVSIPAGQSQVDIGVIGVSSGTTLLRLSGGGLNEPVDTIVYVSSGLASPTFIGVPLGISKGAPWTPSPLAISSSGRIGVAKGLPWVIPSTSISLSGPIGIGKGIPWAYFSAANSVSGGVGIAKGVPWSVPPTVGPLVAPLVGIARQ